MTLIFLRHGESMGNRHGDLHCDDSTNFLSPLGEHQVKMTARAMTEMSLCNFDTIITSTLTRTKQTAVLLSITQGNWKRSYDFDIRLNEWCSAGKDGPTNDTNDQWYLREHTEDHYARVKSFLEDSIDRPGITLVSCHQYTMQATIHAASDIFGMEYDSDEYGVPYDIHSRNIKIRNAEPILIDKDTHTIRRVFPDGFFETVKNCYISEFLA